MHILKKNTYIFGAIFDHLFTHSIFLIIYVTIRMNGWTRSLLTTEEATSEWYTWDTSSRRWSKIWIKVRDVQRGSKSVGNELLRCTQKVWQRLHVQRRGEYCATRAHRLCTKTLIFHHAVIDQIKSRYEESQQERQKQALSRLICGAILKKYRFQRLAQQSFGFLPNDGKSMVDQSGIVVLACIPRRNMTQWQHVIRVMLKNSLSGMT